MVRAEKPAAALQPFVRYYMQLQEWFPGQPVTQLVPARSTPGLEFTLGDPFEAWVGDQGHHETAHAVNIIGAQTYCRVHLAMHGRVDSFAVVFQPGGLSHLFSVPGDAFTNQHFDGRAVLGRSVDELRSRLGESESFTKRSRTMDTYLLRRLAPSSQTDVISAAQELLRRHGCLRISGMAEQTGLSVRQFERRFMSQIGVSPKLYARAVRFEAALKSKLRSPARRWTAIAHELGYHDQMHMVHDFHELAGLAPSDAAPGSIGSWQLRSTEHARGLGDEVLQRLVLARIAHPPCIACMDFRSLSLNRPSRY